MMIELYISSKSSALGKKPNFQSYFYLTFSTAYTYKWVFKEKLHEVCTLGFTAAEMCDIPKAR